MAGFFQGQDEFRIEELTGKQRVVVLRGGCLPFRPVSWDAKQRVSTTWYPGNPRATQQVLGPEELPTEVKGIWRVRRLLDDPAEVDGHPGLAEFAQVTDPQVLRDVLDSIRASGQELKVSWAGIVRTGRITLAKFPHDRLEDIGWELTFDWNGRGQTRRRAFANLSDVQLSGLERAFQSFVDAVNRVNRVFDAVEGTDPTSTAFSARTLITSARKIQSAVSRATALAERATRVAKLPIDIVSSYASIATDIRAQVQSVVDGVADTPTEVLALRDDVEHVFESYTVFHTSAYQAGKLAEEATRQEKARRQRVEPDFLDVIVGREGTSLRELARRYYGDPDAWQTIADANNLDRSVLEDGKVLIIPKRKGGR